MAINKYIKQAIKRLSYYELNVKENYELVRAAKNIMAPKPLREWYRAWDQKIYSATTGQEIPVRIFSPGEEYPGMQILLFFHGGGWVIGNIDNYTRICARMAKITGALVISVDYRLAPEHKFPAGLNDCYDVTQILYENIDLFQTEFDQVTLIGDSAGGNLAAAVSLMRRDRGLQVPAKQILIYPATYADHTEASPFPSIKSCGTDYLLTAKRVQDYIELYASCPEDLQSPYFAPLLAKNFENQPATLAITAQYDPLRDEGEAYAKALFDAGNKVQLRRISDGIHGFLSLPVRSPLVSRSYRYINAFLKM